MTTVAADWLLELWQAAPTPPGRRSFPKRPSHVFSRLTAFAARRPGGLAHPAPEAAHGGARHSSGGERSHPVLAERLRLINRQIKEANRKLDKLTRTLEPKEGSSANKPEQRDVAILRSLPGVGEDQPRRAARRGQCASQAARLPCLEAHVRGCSGDPAQRQDMFVVRRLACNARLERALYHWARVASQRDPVSRKRYAALRQRGLSHGRALRTVGDGSWRSPARLPRQVFSIPIITPRRLPRQHDPSLCSISSDPSLRPDLPYRRAPRASAVQDAARGTGDSRPKRPGQASTALQSTIGEMTLSCFTAGLPPRRFPDVW